MTIDEWIELYEKDKMEALTKVLSFAVQASGCSYSLSEDEIKETELETMLETIIKEHFVVSFICWRLGRISDIQKLALSGR